MRAIISTLLIFTVSSPPTSGDEKTAFYPDLSDPTAAAFSLGVALSQGDIKTAKMIYVGKDKEFSALLDHFDKAKASAYKLRGAMEAHFGMSPATLALLDHSVDLRIGKVPLTMWLASGEVKREGDTAELTCGLILALQLKKSGPDWKVTKFEWSGPMMEKLTNTMMDGVIAINERVAREVEQGKYRRVYEVYAAYHRIGLAEMERVKKQVEKNLGVQQK